ncbi:endonuclease domain-containing protein [Serratia marcescens]|uniref:endonuclease domain-containing protein n=1 Tax=Serratia marcescens TaxID=615 RepID=UPI001F156DFE|nr:endonuclease domain-containing protein [Serratia marcescens]MDP8728352.1 endonuclease domain-containing protein [Serratia marcescens]
MKQKDVIPYKEKLFKQQNGICPLCNLPLDDVRSSHLDHDHALTGINEGRCRGLLHGNCNTLEGTLLHKFNRSGLKSKTEYISYLENLIQYLKRDYSANPKHPQWKKDKLKQFQRLTLAEMKTVINEDCKTKADFINKFKQNLRD